MAKKKSNLKTWLIGGALTLTAVSMLGKKKYDEAKTVIKELKFSIKNISNFSFLNNSIKFSAILEVYNPTNIDFGATLTSKIAVKRIRVYNSENVLLGYGDTNIYDVAIPAGQRLDLDQVQVNLNSQAAVTEAVTHLLQYLGNDFSRLHFEIDIVAFGQTFTLTTKK